MDLKVLLDSNEDLYKELAQLLVLENIRLMRELVIFLVVTIAYLFMGFCIFFIFKNVDLIAMTCRENELLSGYGDIESSRGVVFAEIKKLIEKNPVFNDKLNFPSFKDGRLTSLLRQRFVSPLCVTSAFTFRLRLSIGIFLCVGLEFEVAASALQESEP